MERKRSKRLRSLTFGRRGEQEGLFESPDSKGTRTRLPDSSFETPPLLRRAKDAYSADPRVFRTLPQDRLRYDHEEEAASLGGFLLDPDGLIRDIDEAGIGLLCADRSRLLHHPFVSFVAKESQDIFVDYLRRVVARGKIGGLEVTMERADNTSFCARLHSTPYSESGGVKEIYTVVSDITPQRSAEEGFRESEERYRIVVENSSDGMTIISAEQTFLYANPRCLQIFGYSGTEEIMGASIGLIVHPDDRERVLDIARRRQKGEHAPSRYEFKGLHKDGSIIRIEAHGTRTSYMKEEAALVLLRDITERRHAEDERRRLSLIVEHAPEMILVLDNAGIVQYANVAFLRGSGRRSEEMVGTHVLECGSGEDGSGFYEALWTRLQGEEDGRAE